MLLVELRGCTIIIVSVCVGVCGWVCVCVWMYHYNCEWVCVGLPFSFPGQYFHRPVDR